ncbi:MAG: ROK family protein [Patescibacteria group bacterium]|nr:ROK family protein [Patescibacteria group bacterium]
MIGLFDIGGTHTRTAVSADGSSLGPSRRFETPASMDGAIAAVKEALEAQAAEAGGSMPFAAVSGCMPGVIQDGIVIHSPHLSGWDGGAFGSSLAAAFPGARIAVANDADAACLGEAVYGAGQGARTVAYMTVSTGVGGGRTVGGAIDRGRYGLEPGHQIIDAATGATLESLVSGAAIIRRHGKRLSELGPEAIARAGEALAAGVHNSIVHWSPDVFVLGGSIVLEVDGLFGSVCAALERLPSPYPKLPDIKKAALGDGSGLYGALKLASALVQ